MHQPRRDSTYHGLCYNSCGALAGMRNMSLKCHLLVILKMLMSLIFYNIKWVFCAGRKEMFYLTTHSTLFILWLYSIGHMVKDHSDSERKHAATIGATLFD